MSDSSPIGMSEKEVSLSMIREAHTRIRSAINRTPVITSAVLDARAGAYLFFKCENFQKAGVFKSRGATNAVFSLTVEEAKRGVITHSSGNHGAALARAAHLRQLASYIVMPADAPQAKQAAVRRYGGHVISCEPGQHARESTAALMTSETGATFVHPYDNPDVIAGQGTIAIELLEQVPNLDVILCAVGGGGLLSGISVAAKGLKPDIQIVAVEPAGADDAARSFEAGRIVTIDKPASIADGLLATISKTTFAYLKGYVDYVITVSEGEIVDSMRRLWETLKVIVEPSGAVAYAGVEKDRLLLRGKRIGVILSGGNLDLDRLPWRMN